MDWRPISRKDLHPRAERVRSFQHVFNGTAIIWFQPSAQAGDVVIELVTPEPDGPQSRYWAVECFDYLEDWKESAF